MCRPAEPRHRCRQRPGLSAERSAQRPVDPGTKGLPRPVEMRVLLSRMLVRQASERWDRPRRHREMFAVAFLQSPAAVVNCRRSQWSRLPRPWGCSPAPQTRPPVGLETAVIPRLPGAMGSARFPRQVNGSSETPPPDDDRELRGSQSLEQAPWRRLRVFAELQAIRKREVLAELPGVGQWEASAVLPECRPLPERMVPARSGAPRNADRQPRPPGRGPSIDPDNCRKRLQWPSITPECCKSVPIFSTPARPNLF